MASKLLLSFLLLISLTFPSLSPAIDGVEEAADLPCVKELLPCQPYLHESNPPSQCCSPLLRAIQREAACLCAVFYSEPILKALNFTQEEALKLPQICGGNVPDIGNCNDAGGSDAPTPSPPTATPPLTPWKPSPPSNNAPTPEKPSPPSNSSSPSSISIGNSIVTVGLPVLAGGIVFVTILALI